MTGAPQMQTPAGAGAAGAQETEADGAIVAQQAEPDKEGAKAIALAALAGCGLYRLASGAWLLTRWGLAKECPDLRSVHALLQRMGGSR